MLFIIINASLLLGYTICIMIDRGAIELLGPHDMCLGLSTSSKDMS